MDINDDYTLTEFQLIPYQKPKKKIWSVIIVPMEEIHDSGFRCMKFILCGRDGTIIGAVAGWADVIHLNGIGGYGLNWEQTMKTHMTEVVGWSMDCLQKSGCIRIFANRPLQIEDIICSDFDLYVRRAEQ